MMAILGLGNGGRYRKLVNKAKETKRYAGLSADAAVDHKDIAKKLTDSAKGFFASNKSAKKQGAKVNLAKAKVHKEKSIKGFADSERNFRRLDNYKSKVRTARLKAAAGAAAVGGVGYAASQKGDR